MLGINAYKATTNHAFFSGDFALLYSNYTAIDTYGEKVQSRILSLNLRPALGLYTCHKRFSYIANLGLPIEHSRFKAEGNGGNRFSTLQVQPQLAIAFKGIPAQGFGIEPFLSTTIATRIIERYQGGNGVYVAFGELILYTFDAGLRLGTGRTQGYVQVSSYGINQKIGDPRFGEKVRRINSYSLDNISIAFGLTFRLKSGGH